MDYLSTPLELVEIKADSSGAMQFTAYASTFGNKDHGGDIVTKGAFKASLADRKFRPLLWQHDMREPIGIERSLREDSKGLLGTWELVDTTQGLDVYKLLKRGAVRSMSIGYLPTKWELVADDEQFQPGRILKEVDLLENSVVSLPMNEQAQVQSVKHLTFCASCMEAIDTLDADLKATWTAAYVNALPDSAFALVYTDDAGNKQRKLPHHNADGAVDLPHLRNALARAPQMTGVSDAQRARAVAHLQRHANAAGVGKADEHEHEEELIYADMTLAQLASATNDVVAAFGERTRDLLSKLESGDFSLTEAKRTDLQALLETFSGIDAVRHNAEAVLAHKQEPLPDPSHGSTTAMTIELIRHRLRARGVEV